MEVGGKDRPPMLAPGNYIQWKSRIKRYVDTKPNNEVIHYCLHNPPYKFKWNEKIVPVAEGSSETTTEGNMENYKNVSQDIKNQLDAEAEVVQIIIIGIDNDIYSTFDACPNACEISQQAATRNRGKAIVNFPPPTYDQEPEMVSKDDALSKEKEIDKLMALISLSFKKIYKPINNKLRTSSNTSRANQDNTPRINKGTKYNTDDRELEAHSMYMAQIQKVTPDASNNYGPIFDIEPLQKVQNDDDNYNVFANDREYLEQPESVNDTNLEEQGDTNITIDSLDMSTDREMFDQDDDDLARERDLLASLIDKLKCEINDSKNRNRLLESSNKTLVDKLKGEIEDFKTKNKSLESSNNYFKKANNELSKTNQLMLKDLKKFQAELDRYHDVNYASQIKIDCAKAKGESDAIWEIRRTVFALSTPLQDAVKITEDAAKIT
uniref:Uncharacterized protein n=1 Tax=Tanacetum cinerariifolium TaxID=118510 RepID=A0A6L2LPN6_TANCI|nr:hypothetical protein [Tanacetum cinerariifolium]